MRSMDTVIPLARWRWRATAGAAIIVALAIAGLGGVHAWAWAPLLVVACGGVSVLLIACAWRGMPLPWSWMLVPALAFFAMAVWQWLGHATVAPALTLTGILQLALPGAVFYLALFGAQSRRSSRWAARFVWAATGVLAGEAIFQYFTASGYIYWFRDATYGTPVGPFVYHNHFAGCMLLLLPVAVVVAFRRDRSGDAPWVGWIRRGLVPALGAAALVISQSRGGVLAALGEGGIGLLVLWRPWRAQKRRLFAGTVGVALLFAFVYMANLQPLWNRFAQLAHHDPSATERVRMAQSSWDIFRDHPWTGTGWETFAAIYPRYARFDSGLQVDHAHDEYLQTLSEMGVMGAVLVLAFLALYLYGTWQRWRALAGYDRTICLAACVGTLGFLAQSAVDFEFHAPANAILFFICCALAAAPIKASQDPDRTGTSRSDFEASRPIALG
ncbi:MAG: O-antigen ligase family protein [Acidobacteria bacterium]|nr:MAG: O-antigen ligase family protein [Acidobacteriota bacterium]